MMVNDWNSGKIPFYVAPPQIIEENTEVKFVDGGFGEEFDINQILENNQKEINKMSMNQKNNKIDEYLKVNPEKFVVGDDENDDELNDFYDEEEEDDGGDQQMDVEEIDEEIMKTHAFMTA